MRKFDIGFESIAVVDEKGDFVGTITSKNFHVGYKACVIRDMFLEYTQDEGLIFEKLSEKFLAENIRELPVIKSSKVIARAHFVKSPALEFNENNFPPVYWDLISDATALDFFKNTRRILISSEYGALEGFHGRFKNLFDVSIFENYLLTKYLTGYFDTLIYCEDIWTDTAPAKFKAQKLYAALLNEEIRKYLADSGVHYVRLDPSNFSKTEMQGKLKYSDRAEHSPLVFAGAGEDYFIHADKQCVSWNSINGIRNTIRSEECSYENARRIYFFGACSAAGLFSNDAQTIESFLQEKIIEGGFDFKVLNCANNGGFSGAQINELYRIADTSFRIGDVVIHLPDSESFSALSKNFTDRFCIAEVFKNANEVRPFRDLKNPNHFNPEGNALIANFLWQKLQPFFAKPMNPNRPLVEKFFTSKSFVQRNPIRNAALKDYITELKKNSTNAENVGAVVMNCNPFTLGHRYLIEQALKSVDFLYVFVVEEDSSRFSFKDRFKLAKINCADFKQVKVLPSGKYMISLVTFADYFKKDSLQNQTVAIPAIDLRIFGRFIAPALNIRRRFVGTEPLDTVTKMYNETLRTFLPDFGVELIEIPRLKINAGEYISASRVRECIASGKLESCKSYLTAATWDFLNLVAVKNISGVNLISNVVE